MILPHSFPLKTLKIPFQSTLLADNKWVKLSKIVPWDKFASSYYVDDEYLFAKLSRVDFLRKPYV